MAHLNADFSFVYNTAKQRGYVLGPDADIAEINRSAMQLLQSAPSSVRPEQEKFMDAAKTLGWLTEDGERGIVRTIHTEHHLQRVQFEITLTCNLACEHCYCSSSPSAPRGQSTAFIFNVIDQAAAMGVMVFDITGGEPLARRDIFDILAHIRKRGMVPTLFTNGTLVTAAVAQRLKDIGVASVQTSLDARTPALHDALRRGRNAWQRTVDGIRNLKAVGLPVFVSATASRTNVSEIPALIDFVRNELGVVIRLDRVIPAGRAKTDGIALSGPEFYRLVREMGVSVTKVCESPSANVSEDRIEPHCGVGASYCFIKHDGRVVLCPTMTGAESPMFETGSLHASSLEEMWLEHPVFNRFRGMQCRNINRCPAAQICAGGCRSNAYLLHGSLDSPEEHRCNTHKNDTDTYIPFLERYAEADAAAAK